ncbi:GntR family transcriptional regulator [Roseobacteraceae bacterium NS-SX3]
MTEQIFSAAPDDGSARGRFERMHREIRDRICLLDYAPGSRLSETELAAEFGVSRTPLRRVLARLEDEGLVQSVHGVGTLVTDVSLGELEQTYALRLELAGLISRLSPQPPDAELMARFQAIAERSKALLAAPDARAFAQLNMDFFFESVKLTSNEPLRGIATRLYVQTARIWLKSVFASALDLSGEVQAFDREIRDFIGALSIGDLGAAALIQRAHISMSLTRLKGGTAK